MPIDRALVKHITIYKHNNMFSRTTKPLLKIHAASGKEVYPTAKGDRHIQFLSALLKIQ
jgi:hypothetical protein